EISTDELKKISSLTTPNECLALFEMMTPKQPNNKGLKVALDNVRDPGNFGTIIRLCDWFGIDDLICSIETVDIYNTKVVQATMGSLTRLHVHYTDLSTFSQNTEEPSYGTSMDRANINSTDLLTDRTIVMGNQASGTPTEIARLVTPKIAIPRLGKLHQT